jgi:D-glycero-alpha-D-manno-heptose-7-phosphate kinase
LADIPAGTGLGSSGSFTTALLLALYAFERRQISRQDLAELACHIEINLLNEPIGKQDQFISAYGGLTSFSFNTDGTVISEPLAISNETMYDLEDNLHLFFTGFTRRASDILNFQNTQSKYKNSEMIEGLHYTKQLGLESKHALISGDTIKFGTLMHEHWLHKKRRSPNMSNERIDQLYALGLKNGAIGGKVVGAGGGGFLMFYSQDRLSLKKAMSNMGIEEVRFRFDHEGTKLMLV